MRQLLIFLLFTSFMRAEISVEDALATAQKDLAAARAELVALRSETEAGQAPLALEFETVEQELREKRRLVRIARMGREDREALARQLQQSLAEKKQEATYLAGLLGDFALRSETLQLPGQPALAVEREALLAEGDEALSGRLPILSTSLDRLEKLFGGSRTSGEVSGPEGEVLSGDLMALGPEIRFLGESQSGLVIPRPNNPLPKMERTSENLTSLFEGKETELEIDVTGGQARALQEVTGNFLDLIAKGGLWAWPILGLTVLAIVCGTIKIFGLTRYHQPSDAVVDELLALRRESGDEAAAEKAAALRHPVGAVLARLIRLSSAAPKALEEILYEQLLAVKARATSLLPVLAVTAATAPLLGLLGTVSGMIRTFNLITIFGSGDPKPLAGGISEALVTTLLGLVVAIPVLILHAFLTRKARGITQTTERLGLSYLAQK